MYLKSEKMQNCVSKIRAKNRLARNLFFDSTPSPIKIIDYFVDKELNKENIHPNQQILIEKEDIEVKDLKFEKKINKKRIFNDITA